MLNLTAIEFKNSLWSVHKETEGNFLSFRKL